jgi:hypothetical protein
LCSKAGLHVCRTLSMVHLETNCTINSSNNDDNVDDNTDKDNYTDEDDNKKIFKTNMMMTLVSVN